MPLTKTDSSNPIRGRAVLNNSQRDDCQDVIAMLNYADLGRGAGTLHQSGSARLDLQGRTAAGDVNLQVQVGAATAAAVLVANTALHTNNPMNQQGVANAGISALNKSLDSGNIWNVTGSLP